MPWICSPETNTENYKDCIEAEQRDFVGYGLESPTFTWPGGAVIAVAFTLNYEEGAEFTTWNGDNRSNEFLEERAYHRDPVYNKRDLVVESGFEYGIRSGLPRLYKLFKEFNWPMTIWACSRAFEVTGFWPRLLADSGHEIACHGNRWRGTADLAGPDEEAEHVRKSFKRLQDSTGPTDVLVFRLPIPSGAFDALSPTAFFTGNGSTYHRHIRARIHKELGVPLHYNSDSYAGDLPYWTPDPLALDGEPDNGLLVVPYSLTCNDHKFMVKNATGTSSARDWADLLIADFEVLYNEGLEGRPKMMTVAMHNRVLGKPARALALRRVMEHIALKPNVWVTTRSEIAKFWKEEFPYSEVGVTSKLHA